MIFVTFHTKVFLIIKGYRKTISMDLTLTSVATIGLTLNTANIILTWKRENCLSKHQGVSKYFIILKVILNQCNDVKALGLRWSLFIIQNKQVPSKPCALKGMRWLDCKFRQNTSVIIEVGSCRQWSGVNTSFKRTLRWNNLYLIFNYQRCRRILFAFSPCSWYSAKFWFVTRRPPRVTPNGKKLGR